MNKRGLAMIWAILIFLGIIGLALGWSFFSIGLGKFLGLAILAGTAYAFVKDKEKKNTVMYVIFLAIGLLLFFNPQGWFDSLNSVTLGTILP